MALAEYVSVSTQRDTERAAGDAAAVSAASPWAAAAASATSFVSGGVLPLLAMTLTAREARIPVTIVVVRIALAIAGGVSARLGGSAAGRPIVRTVIGGGLALLLTYLIGGLFHVGGITA